MTSEELYQLLSEGEGLYLECKEAKDGLPKSVWETISAFANTLGGKILLGIKEEKRPHNHAERLTVVGVNDAEKIKKDFWNTVSNKLNVHLLQDSDVFTIDAEGKSVVCINVPQANSTELPVFINGNPLQGSYRRKGEGDYHCSENEVRAMMRDANTQGNDSMLLESYDLDDIDLNSLQQYRQEFNVLYAGHIWNSYDDLEFLQQLEGYVVDRRSRKKGLSLAGLMMFGKGSSIRQCFGNFRMDYVDKSHMLGNERYNYHLIDDGTWENNLYQFFKLVYPHLVLELPRPFKLEGIRRIDNTSQHQAIREALVNAIINTDFLSDDSILHIDKHDEQIRLRNTGLLRLPLEQVLAGGISRPRNPKIQKMFRMIGYGENIGSGFPKIREAWQQAGWPEPLLENKFDLNEVWLTLDMPAVLSVKTSTDISAVEASKSTAMVTAISHESNSNRASITERNYEASSSENGEGTERVKALVNAPALVKADALAIREEPGDVNKQPLNMLSPQLKLTDLQKAILLYLKEQPQVTRANLTACMQGKYKGNVPYNVQRLQEMGLLKREGSKKVGTWLVQVNLNEIE